MLQYRRELELSRVDSLDERQEVVEYLLENTQGSDQEAREAHWFRGRDAFSRYGRIILKVARSLPKYYRNKGEYKAYSAAIKKAFDNEQAFLYTIRDTQTIVGIGSIILNQEIHDGLGQCSGRANLDYYLQPGASNQHHRSSADILYEALALHNEDNMGKSGSQLSGFASVPSSPNPSIGFGESLHYETTGEMLCIEPAGKTLQQGDLYDISHNRASVKLYETK